MSSTPLIFVLVVAGTFLLMIVTFYIYDWFVQRRNRKLVLNAAQSNEIVTSMFPGSLREKVVQQKRQERTSRTNVVSKMKGLLADNNEKDTIDFLKFDSAPLAELYLDTSVMVSGFKDEDMRLSEA